MTPPDDETLALLRGVAETYAERWLGGCCAITDRGHQKAIHELLAHLQIAYMLGRGHEAQGGPKRP